MAYYLHVTEEHNNDGDLRPFLSTGEAARFLGVTPEAVWQNVVRQRIPAMRVGRNWIIPRDALLEFASDYVKGPGRRRGHQRRKKGRSRIS